MSLKDTIQGAREEASATGNPFGRNTDADSTQDTSTARKSGGVRRSAARAKPSREAASGVRVVAKGGKKSQANMSKDERKAERRHEREVEDRRYNVTQAMLEENPEYMKARRMWWGFLIGGVVLMAAALLLYGAVSSSGGNAPTWMGIAAIVSMVLAYIVVIAGLIFDFVKIRPLRKEVEKRTQSMSDKRLKARLVEQAEKKEAEKAARKKRR